MENAELCVSKRFILETTGRDFSSGRTRARFSLRKGPCGACGEEIEEGEVRRLGEAGVVVLGVGAQCLSLSHLPGAHLGSMIQRFQSQEYICPLTGIYRDNACSQRSHPRDPEQSGREPAGPAFLASPEVQPLPLPLGLPFVNLCLCGCLWAEAAERAFWSEPELNPTPALATY